MALGPLRVERGGGKAALVFAPPPRASSGESIFIEVSQERLSQGGNLQLRRGSGSSQVTRGEQQPGDENQQPGLLDQCSFSACSASRGCSVPASSWSCSCGHSSISVCILSAFVRLTTEIPLSLCLPACSSSFPPLLSSHSCSAHTLFGGL